MYEEGGKTYPPTHAPPPPLQKNVNDEKKSAGCRPAWIFPRMKFSFWGFLKIWSQFLECLLKYYSFVSQNWRQQFECILFFPFFEWHQLYRLFSYQISPKYCFIHNDYDSSFFLNDDIIINFGWIITLWEHCFQKWPHFSKKNSKMKDLFDSLSLKTAFSKLSRNVTTC